MSFALLIFVALMASADSARSFSMDGEQFETALKELGVDGPRVWSTAVALVRPWESAAARTKWQDNAVDGLMIIEEAVGKRPPRISLEAIVSYSFRVAENIVNGVYGKERFYDEVKYMKEKLWLPMDFAEAQSLLMISEFDGSEPPASLQELKPAIAYITERDKKGRMKRPSGGYAGLRQKKFFFAYLVSSLVLIMGDNIDTAWGEHQEAFGNALAAL